MAIANVVSAIIVTVVAISEVGVAVAIAVMTEANVAHTVLIAVASIQQIVVAVTIAVAAQTEVVDTVLIPVVTIAVIVVTVAYTIAWCWEGSIVMCVCKNKPKDLRWNCLLTFQAHEDELFVP